MDSIYVKIIPDSPKVTVSQPIVLYAPRAGTHQYGVVDLPLAGDLTQDKVVRRGERGIVIVGTPSDTDTNAATPLYYVRDQIRSIDDKKLDKLDPTQFKKRVYTTSEEGGRPYSQYPVKFSMMWRDENMRSQIADADMNSSTDIVNVNVLKNHVANYVSANVPAQIETAIDNIPSATRANRGMMTALQVFRLEKIYNLLEEDTDKQINKINEVFSAFEGFDEEFVLVEALNNKLDKNTETGSARVYGVDKTGTQALYKHTSAADVYTLMSRDNKGRAKVGAPVDDAHIANKAYVDSVSGAKVVDLTDDLHTSTFKGYEYYIVTAICGTYGKTHCATWTITNKLLEMVPEGQTVYFAPYEFTSMDSEGADLLHVLSLEVYIDDPTQMSFNVYCECSGMTTDDLFNVYVEGVK